MPLFDNAGDSAYKAGLGLVFLWVGESKIGEDIATAVDDRIFIAQGFSLPLFLRVVSGRGVKPASNRAHIR
jgi:hypothetical protein